MRTVHTCGLVTHTEVQLLQSPRVLRETINPEEEEQKDLAGGTKKWGGKINVPKASSVITGI